MRSMVKLSAAILLLINGVGALYGGYKLITSPDGTGLHLPLDLLRHTPFSDYYIPGLILFIVNGLISLFVLGTLFVSKTKHPSLVIFQGALLTGWIIIQLLLLRHVVALHIVMGVIGGLLILLGYILRHISAASHRYFPV